MLHSQVRISELHRSASSPLSFFVENRNIPRIRYPFHPLVHDHCGNKNDHTLPYIELYVFATQISMYNYARIISMCHSETIFISWLNREFNRDI